MRPWRTVLADPAPRIREGRGGVLGPDTDRRARWWEMRAECGHLIERTVRYTPSGEGRGCVRHRGRQDVLPAPRRIRCEHCQSEAELCRSSSRYGKCGLPRGHEGDLHAVAIGDGVWFGYQLVGRRAESAGYGRFEGPLWRSLN